MIYTIFFEFICRLHIKKFNLAENRERLAENLKKYNSAEISKFAFSSSGSDRQLFCPTGKI